MLIKFPVDRSTFDDNLAIFSSLSHAETSVARAVEMSVIMEVHFMTTCVFNMSTHVYVRFYS
jgi:hypothetical protein